MKVKILSTFLAAFTALFGIFNMGFTDRTNDVNAASYGTEVRSSASAMALVDGDTGELIYSKNCDARREPASTTKICTAITVLEHETNLDIPVPVPKEAVGIEGSSLYLKAGELLSVRDLLYGLMLQSGNDCAVALAIIVGGSVPRR